MPSSLRIKNFKIGKFLDFSCDIDYNSRTVVFREGTQHFPLDTSHMLMNDTFPGTIPPFKRNLHREYILTNAKGEETMGVTLGLRSWIFQSSMQLTITHMLLR